MICGMTAFARREARGDFGMLACEIRSVNHRYLEAALRLPDALRELEPALRESLRADVSRGKVDVWLRHEPPESTGTRLEVNHALAARLVEAAAEIDKLARHTAPLERWPTFAHAGVLLELIEATGDVQLAALQRGEIDAGFLLHSPGFAPAGMAHLPVASEPLVLAVPDHHAFATAPGLDWAAVLGEPLVMFPRRILPSLHDAVFGLYHAAGCSPQVVQEAIQMQTIVNLVSAGLGVAWVPQSVRQFQRVGVVYREVAPRRGMAAPACETSLVWPAEGAGAPLARFVECVREVVAA